MDEYRKYEPIFGSWYLSRSIGKGSFGKVFEITREEFGETYKAALKIISVPQDDEDIRTRMADGADLASVSEYYKSILKEIVNENRIMSRLKGTSNIVSYEDHQIIPHEDGIGYDILIRMELLTPLLDRMIERSLTEQDVVRLGIDICRALELCHKKNIIHRDIKPQNIFISDNGDYKLGDFGISRTMEKTIGGMSKKGTPKYVAPEVFKGDDYDHTVDIYSLGIVLFTLLNGNRGPFLPAPPATVTHNDEEAARMRRFAGEPLPAPANAGEILACIIQKACAYDPSDRYRTASQMRKDLESYLANYSIQSARMPAVSEADHVSSGPTETAADVIVYDSPAAPSAVQASALPQTKKKTFLIAAACLMLAVMACFAGINGCGENRETDHVIDMEIDIADLMTDVTYNGFNGSARMDEPAVDEEKRGQVLDGIENDDDRELMDELLSSIEYTADKNDVLSNGDIVTITATYDEALADQLGVSFAGTEKEITVEGLPEDPEDISSLIGTWEYLATLVKSDSSYEYYDAGFDEAEIVLSSDSTYTITIDGFTSTGKWEKVINPDHGAYDIILSDETVTGEAEGFSSEIGRLYVGSIGSDEELIKLGAEEDEEQITIAENNDGSGESKFHRFIHK